MEKIIKYLLIGFVFAGVLNSCVEDQDFDQYDNIRVEPLVESGLLYVETPEQLINLTSGVNFYSQNFNFDAFSEPYVAERILEGLIVYEVENTTSKELDISIEFLDAGGNVLDTENFSVDPAPTAILRREITYGGASGRSLDILRNTSSVRVNGTNLGDTTSVSSLPDPKIILRSTAQLRIRLK